MSFDFFGKGLKYPFRFQSVFGAMEVSAATSREHEHIRESILQILGACPGERFINPEFGSKLNDLVFAWCIHFAVKLVGRHYNRWSRLQLIIHQVFFFDFAQKLAWNELSFAYENCRRANVVQ